MAICEIGCADGYVISTRSRDKAAIASAMSIFTRSSACFAWNASAITCRGRKLHHTLVRKPDAGDPHVRFDERDLETERSAPPRQISTPHCVTVMQYPSRPKAR